MCIIKPHRLDGEKLSLQEAKTNLAKNGNDILGRISIGVDDDGQLVIEDGRHLLEAYRQLQKDIPLEKMSFTSKKAEILFYQLV